MGGHGKPATVAAIGAAKTTRALTFRPLWRLRHNTVFFWQARRYYVKRCPQHHQAISGSGKSAVGTVINVRHLAPATGGHDVRAEAGVVNVEGKRIEFRASASDGTEEIGTGTHQRMVIDPGLFNERLAKRQTLAAAERKTCANENPGRRRRWESCQNTCHRTEAKAGNRLWTQNDGATDGLPREETCAGLGIRCRIRWLSRAGSP